MTQHDGHAPTSSATPRAAVCAACYFMMSNISDTTSADGTVEVSPKGDELEGVLLWMPDVGETVYADSAKIDYFVGGPDAGLVHVAKAATDAKAAADRTATQAAAADTPSRA
mgnify:CR=1 FL=1